MTTFQIYWDNGNSTCGTFSDVFATEAEAEVFGESWRREMCAIDGIDPEDDSGDSYSFEVIEADDQPDPDALDEEAAWYEELNRGYERDRI